MGALSAWFALRAESEFTCGVVRASTALLLLNCALLLATHLTLVLRADGHNAASWLATVSPALLLGVGLLAWALLACRGSRTRCDREWADAEALADARKHAPGRRIRHRFLDWPVCLRCCGCWIAPWWNTGPRRRIAAEVGEPIEFANDGGGLPFQ
jgi:hypothetical protein